MTFVLALLLALGLGALLLRVLVRTPPADLARQLRMAGGAALMLLAAGLLFLRQFALALPVGLAGFMMLRRQAAPSPMAPSGQASAVRSAGLDMMLDHDTGDMDGEVLAGRHAGRTLSALRLDDLLETAADFRADPDSLRLLETYLDRAHPGWRDDVQADETRRKSAASRPGGISTHEAYEILGLETGSSEAEVREAHRRLMKQVHPDRGGSAALAAKINEAKERILGKHP